MMKRSSTLMMKRSGTLMMKRSSALMTDDDKVMVYVSDVSEDIPTP